MSNLLQTILTNTGLALSQFRSVDSPQQAVAFFQDLGYDFQPGAFGSSLSTLASKAGQLANAAEALSRADSAAAFTATIDMLTDVKDVISAIRSLREDLPAAPGIEALPQRLTDFLILDYLENQNPDLHGALHVIGLIEHDPEAGAGQPQRSIHWNRLGSLLSNPRAIADQTYQWNNNFDFERFLERLDGWMRANLLPGGFFPQSDEVRNALGNTTVGLQELRFPFLIEGTNPQDVRQFGINFSPVEGGNNGIALLPFLTGTDNFEFEVCERGELLFETNQDINDFGVVVRPPGNATGVLGAEDPINFNLEIREVDDRAGETTLFGIKGGTQLSIRGLGITWFARNLKDQLDVGLEGQIKSLRLEVAGGDGDGFLQKVLAGLGIRAEGELSFGFTLQSGFILSGGAALAIELPLHIDLGSAQIKGLGIELLPKDADLLLRLVTTIELGLGPMQAVVEDLGLESRLEFSPGNLGPANLDLSFKPPSGVGLSLDVGIVKGAGYLFIDREREEYAGALELVFGGFLSVKAIGLITTRLPDGSNGFSLLLIISAEFVIQLGFGFTLLGVGGLLGLNRTVRLEPLAEGVRDGGIESVLFPKDVVANAPRIINDLQNYFPPEEGTFLIGPMVKLGWGTPTLISVSMGIIIEIPGNIAILGVIKIALPDERAALIIIQVNFIGAIEFDKGRLWFFATLFESRILFNTIEGGMGLLVAWGNDPDFVVSVGGLHPAFNPPPLPFPTPDRVAFNMVDTPVYKIRVSGYFGITANTVQFGAKCDVQFGLSKFGIKGHLSLDVLFQFSPFYFIVEISGSFEVTVFGRGAFSVHVKFSLEGPSPYRAKGYGKIKILFFKFKVKFDVSWGEKKDTTLPPVQVIPLIEAEIRNRNNWKIEIPSGSNLLVSLRKLKQEDGLVLHPVGSLTINQRAIPLNLTLDKVGNQKPEDANRFSLSLSPNGLRNKGALREQFAIGRFREMDDSKKLSSPSFEKQTSGIELAITGNQYKTDYAAIRTIRYEEVILDVRFRRRRRRFFRWVGRLFNHFVLGGAVTTNVLSNHKAKQLQPFEEKVAVLSDAYTVAFNTNNQAFNQEAAVFASKAEATDYMNTQISEDPNLATVLHVIPQTETGTGS